MRSPKNSAYNIHEWIQSLLKLKEDHLRMIRIYGPRKRVYIKLVSAEKMQAILQDTGRQQEYNHVNGEISTVTIERVGMGVRKVRVTNLPTEIKDTVLSTALTIYGDVKNIQEEN
jgi:hypothetical protein